MGQEEGGGAEGRTGPSGRTAATWYQGWSSGHKVYEGDASAIADDIYVSPSPIRPENMGVEVREDSASDFFGFADLYTTDAGNSVGFWSNMVRVPGAAIWGGATRSAFRSGSR